MTKSEAQKLVQEKMRQVQELLTECEAIADEHRFVICLPTHPTYSQIEYLPKDLTDVERRSVYTLEEAGLKWCGIQDHVNGGEWLSSSSFGDC